MKQPAKVAQKGNIASFFTRHPKPAAAAAEAGEGGAKAEAPAAASSPNENAAQAAAGVAKPAAKRKPEEASAGGAPAGGAEGKQMKRLRKAGGDAPAQAAAAAADELADDLEDAEASPAPSKTAAAPSKAAAGKRGASATPSAASKGKAKRSSPGKGGSEGAKAAAVKKAAAKALAEADSEAEELSASTSSEAGAVEEGEEEASPSPSSSKKAKKGSAQKLALSKAGAKGSKVEGVGTGAIKAAALHGNFDVSKLATWEAGKPVPFSFLADTFDAIAETSKRLEISGMLTNAFRAVIATTPEDLLPMVYLCTNRVAPAHEGIELGIGDATLIKALAAATGKTDGNIKKAYEETGDLGLVACNSRGAQKTLFPLPPLTLRTVFAGFKQIAAVSGDKSQDRKKGAIQKLLTAAKGLEAGYVMRALQGKLRIGLAEQTVLVALAHAAVLEKDGGIKGSSEAVAGRLEQASQIVKQVYSECPSFDELIPALLAHPIEEVPERVHFKPGVPIKPMLAKPTTGVTEVLDKFTDQEFTCEYKYDGERAQIHVLEDGSVKIYSRNSEDNTGKYPDIVSLIPKQLKPGVTSVVLDAEAVAYDREANKVLPFQVLSTRARKDVTVDNIKVAVCVFAFDCLSLNGRTLLREPLTARREALYSALNASEGHLEFATAKTSRDVEELTRFLDESVEAGTEGLIVKTVADSYEPSKRSSHWLKLKKDYLEGVGDTFDLVPIGAWYGKGKRTGVFGSYLLAAYDADNEQYQTISKIGTGFSEELLKQLAEQMQGLVIPAAKPYYRFGETLIPDVWFDAKAVWEVKCADMSISPVHKAAEGLVDPAKGISIRFPRLVRVRDDKGPEDATSAEQVAEMYRAQAVLQQKIQKKGGGDDDDL
ncbi:DNA ligase 1-like isoform B [Chlorella sorokiniana]|uniref:DNA ligase n=1 Tax=Chlorella sorokiniana TaxID=3076 RepID=A0A2P6TFK8_CHLSO|nr:DNA ligase 1-like isoform B [Chlorella sorokiniana]|eukprot:PRW32906.1 DNA ligase 1-like isoform B [Chlorella sorokiniana]